ncbi:MAG: DUF5011 domain-containing protein, partial [Chloroflexi bacterium]|nr:DUF5011 domain-containing protein [Chloroflexota bacterium]
NDDSDENPYDFVIKGRGVGNTAKTWAMDTDLSTSDASFWGEDGGDQAGRCVSSAGDVNGDGYDDLLIGTDGDEDGGSNAGQTYLILGKSSGWAMDTDLSTADASFWGEDAGDQAGRSVSSAGDVNGDGYDDLLIGADGADDGGSNAGQTYLILGGADITLPTVSTYSPVDDATGVATTANLVVTFDENVVKGTGNITIKKSSDNSVVETIDVTSGQVTVSGATVTINPSSDFASLTGYYVQIDATAFDDTPGNSYAGISDTTTWNFTTADIADPIVSMYLPVDNATAVATTANLVLTFDENVNKGTGNITIKKSSDNSVVETIDVTSGQVMVSGATVTIDPTSDFDSLTGYYVQIDDTTFDDISGNSYAGITDTSTWNFTTADEVSPIITLIGLANITLEAGVDTYTEQGAIADDNVDGIFVATVGGVTVDVNTVGVYVVTYNAIDSSGNAATQVTRTVNVVDTMPPVITLTGTDPVTLFAGVDCPYTEQGAT